MNPKGVENGSLRGGEVFNNIETLMKTFMNICSTEKNIENDKKTQRNNSHIGYSA